jgi:LPXTG-motif cell wall-anchored protein
LPTLLPTLQTSSDVYGAIIVLVAAIAIAGLAILFLFFKKKI